MQLTLLTDYKGFFGSKWKSSPYRSGYDQKYLTSLFEKEGFSIRFVPLNKVDHRDPSWKNAIVLYTSSEEIGMHYKQYVEDVVLGLEMAGAQVIPAYALLRANNNKSFMEIYRDLHIPAELRTLHAQHFGTLEELQFALNENQIEFPCVIKKSAGAMSRGVHLAHTKDELIKKAKLISASGMLKIKVKEKLRERKHPGYKPDSMYAEKFIIQPFVPELKNDWKVIIYGDHFYVLKRHTKEGDFRASGSGHNYKAGSAAEFPLHMFDLLDAFYRKINVPNFSIDFGFDGTHGYIFEYQGIYFGTSTTVRSADYYIKRNGTWEIEQKTLDQEQEYVQSIVQFLKKNKA